MKVTDPSGFLGKVVTVVLDRPMGSCHPRDGDTYPVNYGYVPRTRSPDGHELDAYVLLVDGPLETFTGTCVAVIERLDDDDPKLIVVPVGRDIGDETIRVLTRFQEQYFQSRIVRGAGA